jgi:hypothetical protein
MSLESVETGVALCGWCVHGIRSCVTTGGKRFQRGENPGLFTRVGCFCSEFYISRRHSLC